MNAPLSSDELQRSLLLCYQNVMGIARNNAAIMGTGPRIAIHSDQGVMGRQENLATIQRLQQQLVAAQQQEQMYQKIEVQVRFSYPR